jgi:hypothetical protein
MDVEAMTLRILFLTLRVGTSPRTLRVHEDGWAEVRNGERR